MKKRDLTPVEAQECEALKGIYRRKRKSLGLTQEQLGEMLGITQSGVSMYLSGRNALNLPIARKFAKALDVNISAFSMRLAREWVALLRDRPGFNSLAVPSDDIPDVEGGADFLHPYPSEGASTDDIVQLPFLEEVECPESPWLTRVAESPDYKFPFSRATLQAAQVAPEDAVIAKLRGRSMERLILPNSSIAIDRLFTTIVDGEIYAIQHSGMLRVKYLYLMPGNTVRLRSENSTEYPDETMTAADFESAVTILGRVFWWSTLRPSPKL